MRWLLLALLVTGCASKQWTRPGATLAEFNRDSYMCAQQARQLEYRASANRYGAFEKTEEGINGDLYRACMRARGYEKAGDGEFTGLK